MNLIAELESGLEAIRGRMDKALESIEGARTVQESWDDGADALAKTAAELAGLVTEARAAVGQVESAVKTLGKALDVLEGADTARLVAGIQHVQDAVSASERGLREVGERLISDLREVRSQEDGETRALIRRTDTARGAADDTARAELARILSNRIAQSDARRDESDSGIRDFIRTTDAARGATDDSARAELADAVSDGLAKSDEQREKAHRATRELVQKTDASRGKASEASHEQTRGRVAWAVIPGWISLALLVLILLRGGAGG